MNKINIAVLFGGKSSEHEISRVSASAIIKNLSAEKYNLFIIGITPKGEWYLYEGDTDKISTGEWENEPNKQKAFISPDSSIRGITVLSENLVKQIPIDAVIPALHGHNGEDGTIQGLLTLSGIPFVGCGTAASAACMDKAITSTMLISSGITKPRFFWFNYMDFKIDQDKIIKDTEDTIGGYPMFVKPANSGSSVGVSKVRNRTELISAFEIAKNEDKKIVVEQAIDGQEVECAVLGNDLAMASAVGEIVSGAEFYDYSSKYIDDTSELFIPARIPDKISEEIKSVALEAYKIMGCEGLARIDFFVEKGTNKVFLNEINTFPGFTPISMYPKLMEYIGIDFPSLLDKLIGLAVNKKSAPDLVRLACNLNQ